VTSVAQRAMGHAGEVGAYQIEGFEAWLEEQQMAWQPLSRGEYGITLEQAQMAYISQDPLLWCQAFLNEPDNDEPYTFWDYQKPSVESWQQDVIHQDGAEVGKTREITALILWGQITAFGGSILRPSILVAAPQQTHLDEIIMDMEGHLGITEDGGQHKPFIHHFWLKPKRTPHYMARFMTPNPENPNRPRVGRVYFRPAGHDGEAFRGVHVNALGLFDEAAKIKNKTIWSEFFRSLKPGCKHRIYSVPDGDNASEFYRMCQKAIPNLPTDQPGQRLFHWAKTLMPEPFWSDDRKQHFVRLFGGEDSPGYQRNVLGLNGQQENPVWPWSTLEPNFQDIPEYRCIKLLFDKAQHQIHLLASKINLISTEGKRVGEEAFLDDRYDSQDIHLSSNGDQQRRRLYRLLREFITPPPSGLYWFGGDLGYAKDPTELFVFHELGSELRLVVRLHLKGMDYDQQADLIFCLDRLFGFSGAWGLDFGSAGTMVVQLLQNREEYQEGDYENRLTGFLFAQAMEATDEEGNVVEEEDRKTGDRKALRLPAKQLATDLMGRRFQRSGYALPMDNDLVQHLTNHTAREGARHLIYDKSDDHTIDAMRVAILRKVFNEDAAVDLFSASVFSR